MEVARRLFEDHKADGALEYPGSYSEPHRLKGGEFFGFILLRQKYLKVFERLIISSLSFYIK